MIASKFAWSQIARNPVLNVAKAICRPACDTALGGCFTTRCYAAPATREPALDEACAVQTDMVRAAVKELLEQKEANKTITVEQLHQSHENFKSLLNEARLCIADCEESKRVGDEDLEEETAQAAEAVDDAFAAYLDMLEEFQGCDEELRKQFADARDESTSQLKSLRNELDQILHQKT